MSSLQSLIILVEDVINIIRNALYLEVSSLPIAQEVALPLLAAPPLFVVITPTRLP